MSEKLIDKLTREIDELKDEVDSLSVDNSKSRNYQTKTLYQFLCDRYGVSYYTPKDDLLKMVEEEL